MPKHPAASILVDIAKAMSLEYSAFPNCALNIQVYGGVISLLMLSLFVCTSS